MLAEDPERDPAEWLRRAGSSMALCRASRGAQGVLYEDLCFLAQQAAEKAIKGVLVSRGVEFPKTHAIATLLTLAEENELSIPDAIRPAAGLTRYAVTTRYPAVEQVIEEDYVEALELAERVVAWAESLIL